MKGRLWKLGYGSWEEPISLPLVDRDRARGLAQIRVEGGHAGSSWGESEEVVDPAVPLPRTKRSFERPKGRRCDERGVGTLPPHSDPLRVAHLPQIGGAASPPLVLGSQPPTSTQDQGTTRITIVMAKFATIM